MCEFCTQHGEGEKWYLVMENYSRELLSQEGRVEFMEDFLVNFEKDKGTSLARLDSLRSRPKLYRFFRRKAEARARAEHWGQVVPIEEIIEIVDMLDSVVRMPCVCRSLTTGRKARYCFGIGIDPHSILGKYPDYSHSLEVLEREEAKELLTSFDKKGLVHSVWTFKTPYIGGICNCDMDCLAYRAQVKSGILNTMFRAEYVGMVDWELCNGCRRCLSSCQFGAVRYSHTMKRAAIDTRRCYGCGVCRAVCEPGAITLSPRRGFAGLSW